MYVITMDSNAMDMKESGKVYMGGIGGKKRKKCNCVITTKENKMNEKIKLILKYYLLLVMAHALRLLLCFIAAPWATNLLHNL